MNYEQAGLGGAFAATNRGQPMMVYQRGAPFFPLSPRPEDLDIETIAHALSLHCRFGGHIRVFYSVAQHCVHVSRLCSDYPRAGLLHDAAEAYLGDIIKPLKSVLPQYSEAEMTMEQVIAQRWGVAWPWPEEVKHADLVMLATEKRDLVVPADQDWGPLPNPEPWTIEPWPPEEAKARFLADAKVWGLL